MVVESAADRTVAEIYEEALMANSGVQDAVREPVMRELRASIREQQMRGDSTAKIQGWIDRREAEGEITEEEGAVACLITRYYAEPIWDAVFPVSIGS